MVDGKVDKVPSTSTLVDPTSSSWARPVLTNARLAVEVFDGTSHFGMWQIEVLDALFQKGLNIAVEESKPEDVEERNWLIINRLACGTTMNDHITSFNQLVTYLMNMDEVFKDQDLALILLGSLSEEYELLETNLLNEKDDVSLSEDAPEQVDLTEDVPGATHEDLFGHDARPCPAGKPRPAKKTKSDATASTGGSTASTQFEELMEQELRLKRKAAERAFEA
nr:retrovirus-related Pol polyprotein from transposon TNT 1-94 [Tanacetum cinerariifolium]